MQALERHGVTVRDGVDLRCETGAGTRTVLVRAGTLRPDNNPPLDATPSDDRPWLAGMERLDDPRLARRFVTSRVLYRRLRRYLWAPPLVLAVIALLLRVEFVVDGLGRVFRTPRQQTALQRAYDATWPSRFIVAIVIAVVLLAVLALVVALTSRGIWRALGGEGLPPPGPAARRAPVPSHTNNSSWTGRTPSTPPGPPWSPGSAGVIVGGALVPELTHLDTGFFACPGATSEVVQEHRGRLGLPPTFLHHRQESTLEIETGAELHVRLLLADADLPLATMGERLVTADTVVEGPVQGRRRPRRAGGELAGRCVVAARARGGGRPHPGAPHPPSRRRPAVRRRRDRPVVVRHDPLREHLHLIAQYLPVAVVQAAGRSPAIAGIGMIMLSRGVLRGQRRSWLVAVLLLMPPRSPSTCCTPPTSSPSSSAPASSRC